MPTAVSLDDLEHALYWASGPTEYEPAAFISRSTGRIFTRGVDGPVDEDFPEDVEDGLEYIMVPHKNDLDLGRQLAFRFIQEAAPGLSRQVVELFRR